MIVIRILLISAILIHMILCQNAPFFTFHINIPNSVTEYLGQINKYSKSFRVALGATKLGYILSLELAEKNDTQKSEPHANDDMEKNADTSFLNETKYADNNLKENQMNDDHFKGEEIVDDLSKGSQFYDNDLEKGQFNTDYLKEKQFYDDDMKKKQFYNARIKTQKYDDRIKRNQFYNNDSNKKQFNYLQQANQFKDGYLIKQFYDNRMEHKQFYDAMKKKQYYEDRVMKNPLYGYRFKKKPFYSHHQQLYDGHQNRQQIDYTRLNKKTDHDGLKNIRSGDDNDENDLDLFKFNIKGLKDAMTMLQAFTRRNLDSNTTFQSWFSNVLEGIARRMDQIRPYVEIGPGSIKSPIVKYPPKFLEARLKHLMKIKQKMENKS